MILLLFGPPGCGKGTQAAFLAERLHIPAISTGEVFRAECKAGTALGKMACSILAKGGLVDDEIVNGIVANRITKEDCAGGFLLDGYPRTVPQAQHFSKLLRQRGLPAPVVVHLHVEDSVLIARLTARRQCSQCGHIYNRLSQPSQVEGRCDMDGAPLVSREDDAESVIRDRLRAYRDLTGPILDWYGPENIRTVDGAQSLERVRQAVDEVVLPNGARNAFVA
ncbi:MAG TPA: adenylate kinase [Candidatus Sulfopaludibacter sp.]|nr:adenylate kinase [Candidatus Sulfopaludibacter sp.]